MGDFKFPANPSLQGCCPRLLQRVPAFSSCTVCRRWIYYLSFFLCSFFSHSTCLFLAAYNIPSNAVLESLSDGIQSPLASLRRFSEMVDQHDKIFRQSQGRRRWHSGADLLFLTDDATLINWKIFTQYFPN